MALKRKRIGRSRIPSLGIPLLVLLLLALVGLSSFHFMNMNARAASTGFVTRSGSNLILNGKQFRFSGANIYWLGLDENVNGIAYPTKFRTDDALATAKEMGATVIRSHTLGTSVGCPQCLKPTLTTYNEAAFDSIDYAITAAKNKDLRLIIPLTDNWTYYHGGKKTFTQWRELPNEEEFYTNPLVIEDFKSYISYLLNHVNKYTGVALKDEPAILAWETGNELSSAPTEWTKTIADHIKGIAPKHLVADGRTVRGDFRNLSIGSVDMYTDHFYPLNNTQMKSDASGVIAKGKVYYVGEFDWTDKSAKKPQATIGQDTSNKISGSRSAKIMVTQTGRDWDIQLLQGGRSLTGGVINTFEFWAKSSSSRNMRVVLQKNYNTWATYTEKTVALTDSWQKYTMTVTPSANDSNVLVAFNVGDNTSPVWIDRVSLISTKTGNNIQNDSFETMIGSNFASWTLSLNAASADPVSTLLPIIETKTNGISGDLSWSLFGHRDDYGYVQHYDSYTLHYPGDTTDMLAKSQLLRNHAYTMQGIGVPSHRCPNAPILQALSGSANAVAISWRGAVGAQTYNIQRSTNNGSSWQTVKTGLTDNNAPWVDTSGRLTYKYRVQGVNLSNVAGAYSDGTGSNSCKSTSTTP